MPISGSRSIAAWFSRPQNGVVIVVRRPSQRRKRLEPGIRVYENQELFKLPDLSRMEVAVSVHESVGPRVKAGMRAGIRIASLGERVLPGHVAAVPPLSQVNWKEDDERLRHFLVRVQLDETPPKLLPLMSAVVEIDTGRVVDSLVIPVGAMSILDRQQVCYVRAATVSSVARSPPASPTETGWR